VCRRPMFIAYSCLCAWPTNTVSTPTKPRFSSSRTSSTRLATSTTPRFRNGTTLGKFAARAWPYYDQAKQLKPMRKEGLLGLANFSCCQDVLRRLDKTFQAFFARVRRGEKPGFPRFRSFRRYDSSTFPSYGDGCRLLDDGKLRIQGAGRIKVKLHRPVEGAIKTVTIKRDVDHWYVCFSVERDSVAVPESSEEIGMDVGLD